MLFIDWLFLAFGISLIVICAKRGFILTLLKFFKLLLSALVAHLLGGAVGAFIGDKFLNPIIRNSVYEKVRRVYEHTAGEMGADASIDAIPKYLQTDAMREKLNAIEGSGEELVNSVTDTVSGAISSVVCGVLGFILAFVGAFLIFSVLYVVVKGAKQANPVFGAADSVCGGILGFVFAFTVLLFAGSVMKFFFGNQPTYADSTVVKFFGESTLLDVLKFLDPGEWLKNLMESKRLKNILRQQKMFWS
jgi:hypothetical protein